MKDYTFTWIRFVQVAPNPKRKTLTWAVVAKRDAAVLGHVSWNTGWRRYIFEPCVNTIYEQDCLRDIATFIEERTREHKAKRTA